MVGNQKIKSKTEGRFQTCSNIIFNLYCHYILKSTKFNIFLGMRLMGRFLYRIIVMDKGDKSLKLEQLFRIIKDMFPKSGTFKPCEIFKTDDGNKAVETAIKVRDTQCLKEIMKLEHLCHRQSHEAILCFRDVIKTDERSAEVIEMLDEMYEQTFAAKYIIPVLYTVPLLLRLISIVYDESSDILLAVDYHGFSSSTTENNFTNENNNSCFADIFQNHSYDNIDDEACKEGTRPEDYQFAKWYIIFSVVVMMILNGPLTRKTLSRWKQGTKFKDSSLCSSNVFLKKVVGGIFGALVSPIIIIVELLQMIRLRYEIARERDDNRRAELLDTFWDLQLEFGMYEAIEAAEASAQLLLQVWLMAPKFNCYYTDGFWTVFRQSIKGTLFVFGEPTSTEDKTLGKFLIAFISITISAFSMYKRTKREAVHTMKSQFLMASILSQIIVHIMCLLPLYFVERHPLSLVLPIVIHYILIFVLKFLFDPSFHLARGSNKRIAMLNVLGSLIINVNLTPPDGYYTHKGLKSRTPGDIEANTQAEDASTMEVLRSNTRQDNNAIETVVHHNPTTFFLQTMYFVIKFLENLAVVLLVMFYCEIWRYGSKIGLTLGLGSLLTWVSHSFYYKVHGHPWKFSNGPSIGCWHCKYRLYLFGECKLVNKGQQVDTRIISGTRGIANLLVNAGIQIDKRRTRMFQNIQ